MTDREKIANMFASYPLYKKLEVDISFLGLKALEDFPFSFFCPNEYSFQTFKLNVEPVNYIASVTHLNEALEKKLRIELWDEKKEFIKYTVHFRATCQYCKKYVTHFLIQANTDKRLIASGSPEGQAKLILKKIGQDPPFSITPNKNLMSFFNDEDKENYKKALICLSQNYGIAAFSYLRRIVEKEIIKIIEDLSTLETLYSTDIKNLLEKYRENHQMGTLITAVYQYLPSSLKDLGNNPLNVLYDQLSGGIHDFSEDECFQKAEMIDELLRFVIIKLNEEHSDVKSARNAIKQLSGKS